MAGAHQDPEVVAGFLGAYRILVSDLVVLTMAEEPQQGAQVIDLMEALKASLEKKPAKRAETAKPATKKAAKK